MAEGLLNYTRLDDPDEVICGTQGLLWPSRGTRFASSTPTAATDPTASRARC